MSRARNALFFVTFALFGCPQKAPSTHPATDGGPTADAGADATAATPTPDAAAPAPAVVLTFSEAIRREEWDAAEMAIAALPEVEQKKPEIRYARARVATARKEPAVALKQLEKVEDELPLLRDLVLKARAKASLVSGPYDKAAEWHAGRPDVASWLVAANAYDKADDPVKARAQCDRIIGHDKHSRAQEEQARSLRLKIVRAKEGDGAAANDARWLAIHALDAATTKTANELLGARPLEASEWLLRAKTMAEAAKTELALEAMGHAENGKPALPAIELCRARADVLYRARTRYSEAAAQWQKCSQMGGARAAEDAFLHARSLSRADKDAEAITAFERVIQKHGLTTWADESAFHIARTHALGGKWKEAMVAFDAYVHDRPVGREKKEAERYRALAHLMAQDYKGARKLLESLVGASEDNLSQARISNLAAWAAFKDGDRNFAIGRWGDIARNKPLTWAALAARAHLVEAHGQVPLAIDPAEPSSGTPEPLAITLPPPVDLLHRLGLDGDGEEALREREALVKANGGGRGTEALCAAYGQLDRGRRRYGLSLSAPSALLNTAPGARNKWAWECSFPRPHDAFVKQSASASRVSPELIWAVMRQESAFDPEVVSPARAIGLLQLLPETASATAKKASLPDDTQALYRPKPNITLGTLYLRELLDQLNGNVPLAVAAYNAGPEAITRWKNRAKGVPLDVFVETIPFLETRGYVVRVMGNLARYGFLEQGEEGVPRLTLSLD